MAFVEAKKQFNNRIILFINDNDDDDGCSYTILPALSITLEML